MWTLPEYKRLILAQGIARNLNAPISKKKMEYDT
jgi:hypothetical protein